MTTPENTEVRLPLTPERVLRAAITMADEQGLASLTMRALGAALGVQAMSLYNHVANKDVLLDGIVDLVVSEIQLPSASDPWKIAMRKRALSAHEVLLRHPWACGLLMSRVNTGPGMLRYIDATLGCLHGAGFSLPVADHAWNALDSYIYGFTLQKLNFPFEAEEYSKIAASYLPALSAKQYPSMHALTTLVAAGAHNGIHDLGFGLELILDGLERVLARGEGL
ncbi:MAG: TetR/AcrR family transcriptional regulator [Pseudomonadota bacterium]|nr:TetR/AcrR family transcriptional regulator [Pseudomonadota bacterium]